MASYTFKNKHKNKYFLCDCACAHFTDGMQSENLGYTVPYQKQSISINRTVADFH